MKTQTQHTPGPWATSSAWNVMKGGTKIATLEQMPGNYESERMANARLISSAPELLSALDRIISLGKSENFGDWEAWEEVIDARAALRKAKGEA